MLFRTRSEQDWRIGARYFEQQLVDHEPCSNMGNWQRSAGVAVALNHRFSIRRQSMRYDREARYIRQWVPELSAHTTIHEMNGRDCSMETGAFGVQLGENYPRPFPRPEETFNELPLGVKKGLFFVSNQRQGRMASYLPQQRYGGGGLDCLSRGSRRPIGPQSRIYIAQCWPSG